MLRTFLNFSQTDSFVDGVVECGFYTKELFERLVTPPLCNDNSGYLCIQLWTNSVYGLLRCLV